MKLDFIIHLCDFSLLLGNDDTNKN